MQREAVEEMNRTAVEFHGHSCPGLAIGVRAAQFCLERYGHNSKSPLTIVAETDMCGVDAIQVLTGCTLGKGNLLHRDVGKMAFTFYPGENGQRCRILLNPEFMSSRQARMRELTRASQDGQATPENAQELERLREQSRQGILEAPMERLFTVSTDVAPAPRGARVLESLVCGRCGESVMESRTRRFGGRTLCIPCFRAVEQKLI